MLGLSMRIISAIIIQTRQCVFALSYFNGVTVIACDSGNAFDSRQRLNRRLSSYHTRRLEDTFKSLFMIESSAWYGVLKMSRVSTDNESMSADCRFLFGTADRVYLHLVVCVYQGKAIVG